MTLGALANERVRSILLKDDCVRAGGMSVLLLVGLNVAGQERYVPLTHAENAPILEALHHASQALAVGLVGLLVVILWRRLRLGTSVAPVVTAWRAEILTVQLAAFAALLVLYQVLPHWANVDPVLGQAERTVFSGMICALFVLVGTGLALALPAPLWRRWRSPGNLAVLAAMLGAATLVRQSDGMALETIRRPLEDTTLSLSVALYELVGPTPLTVLRHGGDPILAADGFAVSLAPVCSGYQGLFGAAALLCGYITLERHSLRLERSFVLAMAALVAVFLLNSARIAVLFGIGVAGWPDIALDGFHSHFGVVSLLVVVSVAILALDLPFFQKSGSPRTAARPSGPAAQTAIVPAPSMPNLTDFFVPLAGLMASGLLLGLTHGTVAWLSPVAGCVGAALLWHMRRFVRARMCRRPSLLGFLGGMFVYAVWVVLVQPDDVRSEEIAAALAAAPAFAVALWIALRIAVSCVVVPLAEELAFRGGVPTLISAALPALWARPLKTLCSVAGASVLFGLLHADIVAGCCAGLVFGSLAVWRNDLTDAVLAHAVTNFLIALTVLGFGHWSYW